MMPRLARIVESANTLGEGVQWDPTSRSVWWTDIQAARLLRYDWLSQQLEIHELPERLGAFALTNEPDVIVAAFASGFARYDLRTRALDWLDRPELGYTGTRFNDGRVDRQGRFWCGTMVEAEAATDAAGNPATASLYCLAEGVADRKLTGLAISNSLCWNAAGDILYFADSPERTIWAFDFAAETAALSNRRVFARTGDDAVPDGSCIDAEDCLWNAEWGGGRVTRYRPDGRIDLRVELPVSQPTCVAFGGPDLDHLLITSARDGLSEGQLVEEPRAGHLLVYAAGICGLRESTVDL